MRRLSAILIGLLASVGLPALAQETTPPTPAQRREAPRGSNALQELHVLWFQEHDEEKEHEEYWQPYSDSRVFRAHGRGGFTTTRFSFNSGSRWRTKDPSVPPPLPTIPSIPAQTESIPPPPWEPPPWRPPPFKPNGVPANVPSLTTIPEIPTSIPEIPTTTRTITTSPQETITERPITTLPSTTTTTTLPSITFSVRVNPIKMKLNIGSGSIFQAQALNAVGSPVTTPGGGNGGGGIVPGPIPQPPPPPPPITKPLPTSISDDSVAVPSSKSTSLLGNDSDPSDDSDSPLLYGPELALPLKGDVTEWGAFRWLPTGTSMNLYGHFLMGDMEISNETVDVELMGVGLRFVAPLINESPFYLGVTVYLGPGFLKTNIGNTAGFDGGAGLQAILFFTPSFSLQATLEGTLFLAPDATALGPAFNVGLNLDW